MARRTNIVSKLAKVCSKTLLRTLPDKPEQGKWTKDAPGVCHLHGSYVISEPARPLTQQSYIRNVIKKTGPIHRFSENRVLLVFSSFLVLLLVTPPPCFLQCIFLARSLACDWFCCACTIIDMPLLVDNAFRQFPCYPPVMSPRPRLERQHQPPRKHANMLSNFASLYFVYKISRISNS